MINQRAPAPSRSKRIVIKDLTQDSHYKISVAAAYNGLTIKDFVLHAIKKYVLEQVRNAKMPEAILTNPTLAPSSLDEWLSEEPAIIRVQLKEDNNEQEEPL